MVRRIILWKRREFYIKPLPLGKGVLYGEACHPPFKFASRILRCCASPTSAPSGHLLPEEGGSVHASPFPWKGLPSAARRGWLPFLRRSRLLLAFPSGEGCVSGIAVFSYLSLPHWGRGTASAVDRVLSLMAHLRRSPSSLSYRQYPIRLAPLATFPTRGRLCVGDSGIPIQPPPLRGTSFQGKEGECRLPL